jgi:hypothetical protein
LPVLVVVARRRRRRRQSPLPAAADRRPCLDLPRFRVVHCVDRNGLVETSWVKKGMTLARHLCLSSEMPRICSAVPYGYNPIRIRTHANRKSPKSMKHHLHSTPIIFDHALCTSLGHSPWPLASAHLFTSSHFLGAVRSGHVPVQTDATPIKAKQMRSIPGKAVELCPRAGSVRSTGYTDPTDSSGGPQSVLEFLAMPGVNYNHSCCQSVASCLLQETKMHS